jgi:AAA domain
MRDPRTLPNPFDSDIVVDPDNAAPVDVPRIHQGAFDVCRRAYEHVAGGKGSWSVFLTGDAGCGKTHLLSRLKRWLNSDLESGPTKPAALFVAIRMETSRGMIWRHLRRRFAEELAHTCANTATNLDVILHRFAERFNGNLASAFDVMPIRDCSEELMKVLEAYAGNTHRRLCRAWLKGDRLSESQLALLDLAQLPSDSLEDDWAEAEARMIVGAVTRIAAPLPVVFCFDQIEALGLSREIENYGYFCRMGANLFDTTTNSLLISTINLDFLNDLQTGSRISDCQRILKDSFDLQLLDWSLGKELIEARLALVPEAAPATPINDDDLHAYFQTNRGRVTPRNLIHEARRLFANWQDKPVQPALSINNFLSAEYDRLWSESPVRRETAGADAVLAHGLPIALQLLGKDTKEKPAQLIDLAAGNGHLPVRIAFGNHANPTSLARWLARLQEQAGANLCIIRDARLGISPTARATQQRLEAIVQSGGRVVRVEAEALAALDAMRHLLAIATSGDLSNGGDTIRGDTVRDWLKKNMPKQITDFAAALFAEEIGGETDWQPDALLELLQTRKLVPLGEAVDVTKLSADKIEAFANRHPDRVCYFGGDHPVVCLAVAPPA